MIIASAVFIPSIAAEVMPPAYPAPSPHGWMPAIVLLSIVAWSRGIRSGEEVRLSLPAKTHPRGQSHESHVQNVPFPLTSLPKALPAAPPTDFQMQTVLQTVVSLLQIPLKSGFPGNLHKAVPGFFRRRSGMPLPPADAGTSRRQVCPAVENPPV